MINLLRTGTLLAVLTALFMGVGYLIGGSGGMIIALLVAAATNLFAYWNADRLVLSTYGARPITRSDIPWLYDVVANLADRANIPSSISSTARSPMPSPPVVIRSTPRSPSPTGCSARSTSGRWPA
jgi:heat shock protein HtpX